MVQPRCPVALTVYDFKYTLFVCLCWNDVVCTAIDVQHSKSVDELQDIRTYFLYIRCMLYWALYATLRCMSDAACNSPYRLRDPGHRRRRRSTFGGRRQLTFVHLLARSYHGSYHGWDGERGSQWNACKYPWETRTLRRNVPRHHSSTGNTEGTGIVALMDRRVPYARSKICRAEPPP